MRHPILLVLALASSLAWGRHCPRPKPKPTSVCSSASSMIPSSMPPSSEVNNPYYYPSTVAEPAPATSTSSHEDIVQTYTPYSPPAYNPPTSVSSPSTPEPTQSGGSSPVDDSAPVTGMSTHYGGNREGGTCSFSTYQIPAWLYGTAFSGPAWNNAANCGACIKVTGPSGNSITAMIVDRCMECDVGHLDLFENAFEQLGPLSAGVIQTSYTFVSCGITSPIVLHNKIGTSQYWFSMQVLNANEPVATLEVSTDGGSSWTPTTRSFYNFFENQSGFRTPTVDVRVTSKTGKVIIVNNVTVDSDTQIPAASNF